MLSKRVRNIHLVNILSFPVVLCSKCVPCSGVSATFRCANYKPRIAESFICTFLSTSLAKSPANATWPISMKVNGHQLRIWLSQWLWLHVQNYRPDGDNWNSASDINGIFSGFFSSKVENKLEISLGFQL